MLISPPFIPAPISGESDEAFVNRAMQGGIPGDGGFPLSFDLNWHGGIHLTAPREGTTHLPVRAIADGTFVYCRQPTDEASASADHGLRYRDQWTDNGCIVLKHETEIGEGAGASVVFYSIYLHLSKITLSTPTKGTTVYRKDELGQAGQIYGQNHRIHFEIIVDQSQIANLVGRSERLLDHQSGNGRTNSCWGDMYFFIPPEVLIYEAAPTDRLNSENSAPVAYRCPAMPIGLPPVVEGGSAQNGVQTESIPLIQGYEWAVAQQLQDGIFVRMSYKRGQCTLTSFLVSGEEIGVHQEEADYEYNLYRTATKLYPERPSAGYELLRFGRVLGPDALQPADAAHWRQIALPARSGGLPGTGWVNLNATTVTKFSDADFPHWQGWQLIDDDADSDSHCQSPYIRSLLRLDNGKVVSDQMDAVSLALSPAYAGLSEEEKLKLSDRSERERVQNEAALRDAVAQKQLKRLICKFPSEWSKNDFDTRYGWLKKVAPGGPLSEESYSRFRTHHQELAFWEDAALEGIEAKHWHFPPKEFIQLFRKCFWLSLEEFVFSLPKYPYYRKTDNVFTAQTTGSARIYQISREQAQTRLTNYSIHLNKTIQKYGISSTKRLSHFLAQALLETDRWKVMYEYGRGSPNPHIPMAQYYAAFYGRGMMQLTWAGNYEAYGKYRAYSQSEVYSDARIHANSMHYWSDPTQRDRHGKIIAVVGTPRRWSPKFDPSILESEPYCATDSGGFFWVWTPIGRGERNLNRVCDEEYTTATVGRVCRVVNGGSFGYMDRQAYAQFIHRYLSDSIENENLKNFETPKGNMQVNFERIL